MRRLAVVAIVAIVALTLTGCTSAQLAAWLDWHATDPAAAVAYANQPDVQAQIADAADDVPTRAAASASVWTKIAACESGGEWSHPPVTNRHGTFSGGLMIMHRYWPHYGGQTAAPYLASRAHQIEVAENIAADVGLDRGWQCWP